jgi:hypothetical protein
MTVNYKQTNVCGEITILIEELGGLENHHLHHLCIACGKEHEGCCGSCESHCYRCSKLRNSEHDEQKCLDFYTRKQS